MSKIKSKEEILDNAIAEKWCQGDTVPECIGWLLEIMEEYHSQFTGEAQGKFWREVDVKDRLPEKAAPPFENFSVKVIGIFRNFYYRCQYSFDFDEWYF